MIGLLLHVALTLTPSPAALNAMADDSWQVREQGSTYLASYGYRVYPILFLGVCHMDLEVRKRCERVPLEWTKRRVEKLATVFPRPEDYPFLDSMWYDTKQFNYQTNDLTRLMHEWYIQPSMACPDPWFQNVPLGGFRQASRAFAADCVGQGVPILALKMLFSVLHQRDKVYLAQSRLAQQQPQPLPVGPPEQP